MSAATYLDTTHDFYREAALTPDPVLCCTTNPVWALPELVVPPRMLEMNYGCGTTVHPRDLVDQPTILHVGIGGALELLQFAYFCRRSGAVIGIEPVAEMRTAARMNLAAAARVNAWFREEFVDIRDGDALALSVDDASVGVAAQNCLFNVFRDAELRRALAEVHRVLRPQGRFVLSDPVTPVPLPPTLAADDRLRAMCLSGAITYDDYIGRLVETGFGTIEVRARRPHRVLDPVRFPRRPSCSRASTSRRSRIRSRRTDPVSSPDGRRSSSARPTASTIAPVTSWCATSPSPSATRPPRSSPASSAPISW
jgi:SAM-dependent methyltransferase